MSAADAERGRVVEPPQGDRDGEVLAVETEAVDRVLLAFEVALCDHDALPGRSSSPLEGRNELRCRVDPGHSALRGAVDGLDDERRSELLPDAGESFAVVRLAPRGAGHAVRLERLAHP